MGGKTKHARFFKLMQQMPDYKPEYQTLIKESLVSEYTLGKTTSLSEMYEKYPKAYSMMLEMMNRKFGKGLKSDELNTARKRVLAVIIKNLELTGKDHGIKDKMAYAKQTACRASNCSEFNRIPLSRLQAVYGFYCTKNKTVVPPSPLDYSINKN